MYKLEEFCLKKAEEIWLQIGKASDTTSPIDIIKYRLVKSIQEYIKEIANENKN